MKRAKRVIKAVSLSTGVETTFKIVFQSEVGAKNSVWLNRSTGSVVYMDSIRRRYMFV